MLLTSFLGTPVSRSSRRQRTRRARQPARRLLNDPRCRQRSRKPSSSRTVGLCSLKGRLIRLSCGPTECLPAIHAVSAPSSWASRRSSRGVVRQPRWRGTSGGWARAAFEEPGVLRRIAHGVLRELADPKQVSSARLEALRALAEDGDVTAVAALQEAVKGAALARGARARQHGQRGRREGCSSRN